MKYMEHPKHFRAARNHRRLERRRGLGAVGAVAGVRQFRGPCRPVRVDGSPRAAGRITALTHRVVGSGLPVGDWLDPTAPPDKPAGAKADKGVIATACQFARPEVAKAADILGRGRSRTLHQTGRAKRAAFARHYVAPDGRILSDTQTAYALAIVDGVLDDPKQRGPGDAWPNSWLQRLPHPNRLRRHSLRKRRPYPHGPSR